LKSKSIETQEEGASPKHSMSITISKTSTMSSASTGVHALYRSEVLNFLRVNGAQQLIEAWEVNAEKIKKHIDTMTVPQLKRKRKKAVAAKRKSGIKKPRTAYSWFIQEQRPLAKALCIKRATELGPDLKPCSCKKNDTCLCSKEQRDASQSPQNIMTVAAAAWSEVKQNPEAFAKYKAMADNDRLRWQTETTEAQALATGNAPRTSAPKPGPDTAGPDTAGAKPPVAKPAANFSAQEKEKAHLILSDIVSRGGQINCRDVEKELEKRMGYERRALKPHRKWLVATVKQLINDENEESD
jgi:hypothetical protein